jgi:hypothetical protein
MNNFTTENILDRLCIKVSKLISQGQHALNSDRESGARKTNQVVYE